MKRFLHVAGILVAGGLIALAVMGLFVKRIPITSSIFINAPVEETWTTFMDLDRMDEWVPEFQSIELIEGKENTVGAKYEVHSTDGEHWVESVTAIVPHERYAFDLEAGPFTGVVEVRFERRRNGTFVQQTTTMETTSFIWSALLPVIKPALQNDQARALGVFSDIVEDRPSEVRPVRLEETPSDTLEVNP